MIYTSNSVDHLCDELRRRIAARGKRPAARQGAHTGFAGGIEFCTADVHLQADPELVPELPRLYSDTGGSRTVLRTIVL